MMRSLIKAGLIWTGILLSTFVYGQDHSIGIGPNEPLGTLPMRYISSFAGETGAARLNLYGHYTWRDIPNIRRENMYYAAMSYDQFIPALRTGIGFSAQRLNWQLDDLQTQPNYPAGIEVNAYYLSLDIAPKFSIKGKYTLSPSINLNYIASNSEADYFGGIEGFGSRFGIMWNTPKYYIGYSFNGINNYHWHFNYPVDMDGKVPYHFMSYLQAGYTFQKSKDSKFSFTPQLVLLVTHPYSSFFNNALDRYVQAFNFNFRYKTFIWGVNNAGIHLGFQNERFRLMLTNDVGYFDSNFNHTKQYNLDARAYDGNIALRYIFK